MSSYTEKKDYFHREALDCSFTLHRFDALFFREFYIICGNTSRILVPQVCSLLNVCVGWQEGLKPETIKSQILWFLSFGCV